MQHKKAHLLDSWRHVTIERRYRDVKVMFIGAQIVRILWSHTGVFIYNDYINKEHHYADKNNIVTFGDGSRNEKKKRYRCKNELA